ncbi:LysM peptidoglycan-binding domain-containing protein [Paenibacillus sp. SYP-B4298]|uniref:LysM peptidoglycan-binding domain-containing protein n=1 Tax=Paenibacillus sp. SYP-B4298 TaxID=2996034 RepID=UPI0022DD7B90|nr:LysM peptidoglycan-binding domain-containing protein [Paenibacillus sp. SYP-B4298]
MNEENVTRTKRSRGKGSLKKKILVSLYAVTMVTLVIICGVLYNKYLNQVDSNLSHVAAAGKNNGSDSITGTASPDNSLNGSDESTSGDSPIVADDASAPKGGDPATTPVTPDTPASEPATPVKVEEKTPAKTSSTSLPSTGGAAGSKAVVRVAAPKETSTVPAKDTTADPSAVDTQGGTKVDDQPATSSSGSKQQVKLPTTYVVQKGDTLSIISEKFYHSKEYFSVIAEHNNILFINDMKVGDTLNIPALPAGSGKSSSSSSKPDYSKVTLPATYLIQAGDTLSSISQQFYKSKSHVELLAKENNLDVNTGLKAGSHLTIPALDSAATTEGASASGSSKSNDSTGNSSSTGTSTGSGAVVDKLEKDSADEYETSDHTVAKGETLYSISRTYYGSNEYASFLADYNHVVDMDNVKIGTVLKIPKLK